MANEIHDTGYIEPIYGDDVTNGYIYLRRVGKIVSILGECKGTNMQIGSLLFTLPDGFRSVFSRVPVATSNGGICTAQIGASVTILGNYVAGQSLYFCLAYAVA